MEQQETTKQAIIRKLFNDIRLSADEITYIGRNIKDEEEGVNTSMGVTGYLPFDHKNENIFNACGLTEDDIRCVNEELQEMDKTCRNGKGLPHSVSKLVSALEKISLKSDRNHRAVIMHTIRLMAAQNQHPLIELLKRLRDQDKREENDDDDGA